MFIDRGVCSQWELPNYYSFDRPKVLSCDNGEGQPFARGLENKIGHTIYLWYIHPQAVHICWLTASKYFFTPIY